MILTYLQSRGMTSLHVNISHVSHSYRFYCSSSEMDIDNKINIQQVVVQSLAHQLRTGQSSERELNHNCEVYCPWRGSSSSTSV